MSQDKKVLLIIDDEEDIVDCLQYEFEAQGYEVHCAANGQAGLKKMQEKMPDCILLDMNMPKMDGREFYEQVCKEGIDGRVPIIALTAQVKIDDLFKGFNVEAYIAKPFNIDQVLKTVELTIKN
ncbi:MAG: response regulator [Candidatus Omnitrophica bacterium]|nr:response regulator [Candidatus Omnitrophota bacterium]